MRYLMTIMTVMALGAVGASVATAGEAAPAQITTLAETTLAAFGSDPVIVEAVKAANAQGQTLAQIQAHDAEWQAFAGIADYMKALMDNPCGMRLREIQESAPYFSEIFAMDNQGANVGMTDKTSDYWQGDEAKFKESYAGGAGAIHVGEVKFDDSTQAYLVQVSVPVRDGDAVIGAITFGIDVDKVSGLGI